MARKARERAESGIYHVVLRGNNKLLFVEDSDYRKFLEIVTKIVARDYLEVYAYILLDECAHFAIKEGLSEISVSIKDIVSSYALWCNAKYERDGKLFKDRFLSSPIESDDYLTDCVRYIHRLSLENAKELNYIYSSYNNYLKKSGLKSDALMLLFDNSPLAYRIYMDNAPEYKHLSDLEKQKLTDSDLREQILTLLDGVSPDEIDALEPTEFKRLVKRFKQIEGASIRQLARVLNISKSFVEKCK